MTDRREIQLRKAVLRLAHEKPELRVHLVPLVMKQASLATQSEATPFSPGDILDGSVSGRGSSVHVFFFQVVKATEKTVAFREIEKVMISPGPRAKWMPKKDKFVGPVQRRKIQHYSGHPTVETSRGALGSGLWDGKPVISYTDDRA